MCTKRFMLLILSNLLFIALWGQMVQPESIKNNEQLKLAIDLAEISGVNPVALEPIRKIYQATWPLPNLDDILIALYGYDKVFILRTEIEGLSSVPSESNQQIFGYELTMQNYSSDTKKMRIKRLDRDLISGEVSYVDSIDVIKFVYHRSNFCESVDRQIKVNEAVKNSDSSPFDGDNVSVKEAIDKTIAGLASLNDRIIIQDYIIGAVRDGIYLNRIQFSRDVNWDTHIAFIGSSQMQTLLDKKVDYLVFSGAKLDLGQELYSANQEKYFTWKVEAMRLDYTQSVNPIINCSQRSPFTPFQNPFVSGGHQSPLVVTAEPCPPYWHTGQ